MHPRGGINYPTGSSNSTLLLTKSISGIRTQAGTTNTGTFGSNRNTNMSGSNTASRYQYAQSTSTNAHQTTRSQGSDQSASNKLQTLPFSEGRYKITLVHSAKEIYGYPLTREGEFMKLNKQLDEFYQKNIGDPDINDALPVVDGTFVVQQDDHFHRVRIQVRNEEVRVQVKFIDRGDECLSDISELLKLTGGFETIPPFVHQFSLGGHENSPTTNQVTRFLKSSLFNKIVHVKLNKTISDGVFNVNMTFDDGESVNEIVKQVSKDPNNPKLTRYLKPVSNQSSEGNPKPFQNSEVSRPDYRSHGISEGNVRSHTNTSEYQQRSGSSNFQTHTPTKTYVVTRSNHTDIPNPSDNMPSQTTRQSFGISRTINNQYAPQNQTAENDSMRAPFNQPASNFSQSSYQNSRGNYHARTNERQFDNSTSRTYDRPENNSNSFHSSRGTHQSNFERPSHGGGFGRASNNNYSNQNRTNEEQSRDSYNTGYRRNDGVSRGGYRGRDNHQNPVSMNAFIEKPSGSFNSIRNHQAEQEPFVEPENYPEPEKLNGSITFVISHFESATQFYAQNKSSESGLNSLSVKLQKERLNWPPFILDSGKVNQPCLALDEDSCWYRAQILSATETDATVRFIDYGNTRTVKKNELLKISKPHTEKGPYAIKCQLPARQASATVDFSELSRLVSGKSFQGTVKEVKEGIHVIKCDELQKLLVEKNIIKKKFDRPLKDAVISYVDIEKNLFYIQDQDLLDTIARLVKEEETNSSILSTAEVDQLNKATKLIAFYEDMYYRAVINSVVDENTVEVFYIDYGNTEKCEKKSLKLCSQKLSSYEPQAKPFKLYAVSDARRVEAIQYVDAHLEDDNLQVSFVKEINQENHVLLYVGKQCINEKFGYEPFDEEEEQFTDTQSTSINNQQVPPIADERKEEIVTTSAAASGETATTILLNEQQTVSTTTVAENKTTESATNEQTKDDRSTCDDDSSIIPETETLETQSKDEKYFQGVLVHFDEDEPMVYLQLSPDSETKLEEINKQIPALVTPTNQIPEYAVGDYVIAAYSANDDHYRARVTAYSSDDSTYTVTFIDYGNSDENVPASRIYKYSQELENIEPQVKRLELFNVDYQMWQNKLKTQIESLIEQELEFRFVDANESTIIIKQLAIESENAGDEQTENTDSEDAQNVQKENIEDQQPIEHEVVDNSGEQDGQVRSHTEQVEQILSGCISSISNDCVYIQLLQDTYSKLIQLGTRLAEYDKVQQNDGSWKVEDLCLVLNDDNQYCRARILTAHENKYDVQLIDYGCTLRNKENQQLFVMPDEDIFNQSPLGHLCQLNEVEHNKSPSEVIDNLTHAMSNNVPIKFQVHNDLNSECWFITLVGEQSQPINISELEKTVLQSFEIESEHSTESSTKKETMEPNEPEPVTKSSDETQDTA